MGEVLMNAPPGMSNLDIEHQLARELLENFNLFAILPTSTHDVQPIVDPVNRTIDGFQIVERQYIMGHADILAALGLSGTGGGGGGPPPGPSRGGGPRGGGGGMGRGTGGRGFYGLQPSGTVTLFGYLDEQQPHHRAFRYMVEGCDMNTLQDLTEHPNQHEPCDRMCVYRMLANLNTPAGHQQPIKIFRPENVNRWLNEHGHAVGGLQDGVSSDAIQQHAIQFKYGHCAMDLARSVVNLYVPFDRNHHYKTACYVITGDHCQPIVDANVVKSIMKSASQRLGRRHVTGYDSGVTLQNDKNVITQDVNAQEMDPSSNRRKRHRSLDRIFKPEFEKSEERQFQDQCQTPLDLEKDDWEETFTDDGSQGSVTMGVTGPTTSSTTNRRQPVLPLASDTDRIHLYTVANDMTLVEEKCKPTYREGTNAQMIHYYICTDQDDVEFLYRYLIRVLKIDPLRYARSFNGRCYHLRMQNTWWFAHRDVQSLLRLHLALYPKEPFRLMGLASYGFRMLQQELYKMTRKHGTIWECMSHYSPNLQRLLDTHHPYNRPKMLQHTFQAPYSNPAEIRNGGSVQVLIPMSQRKRIDLIRSYASTIRNLRDDEYPIHDATNQVVTYNETLHGSIPIGHYLIDLPTPEQLLQQRTSESEAKKVIEEWKKFPCFRLGESRMMSHRMLRQLLNLNLLTKSCIRLVCQTDPIRQRKYGLALVEAMKTLVQKVYCSPELQDICPKHLVNHFVGLCNGTSVPHSGMRYVFQDMKHLVSLLGGMISEDQLQHIKILHTLGYDPMWHRSFDYYEIDSSGLSFRAFHFQPIFNMVLEDQALRMFELARPIPLTALIQINIDALEYRTSDDQWAQDLARNVVTLKDYDALTPNQIWSDYMGRYKEEIPKDESKAATYYYKFNEGGMHHTRIRNATITQERVVDPESTSYVHNWRATLKCVYPFQSEDDITALFVELFSPEGTDRSGLLITGPAGTGKTHLVKKLCAFATNLDLTVVKSAYTHSACVQMGSDAVTLHSLFSIDDKTDVRSILISSKRFMAQLRCLDIDILVIDEISMIPHSILEVLSVFHRVSCKTRFVLVGDFNQLPPVEPHWERGDSYTYFDNTDIFPYLLYDRVRNATGRWVRLTECKRTNDPLLMTLCQEPHKATSVKYDDFPMPPNGIPMWRFISWRNSTRKACNFYCGQRFLQMNPMAVHVRLNLKDVWAQRKREEETKKNRRLEGQPSAQSSDFETKFETLTYKPHHWTYLQNFTYAEGMEVVCRNTLREYTGPSVTDGDDKPMRDNSPCLNNRRAVIREIDHGARTITLLWLDLIQQKENSDEVDAVITLSFYDFAFNFVPGFCVTTHMAQGETIREHYGILEWQEISKMPRMAYVAITRGASSQLLHLVPPYADPWGSSDTSNLTDNVLRKLFHVYRWDKDQKFDLDLSDILSRLNAQPDCCVCQKHLQLVKYSSQMSSDQFAFTTKNGSFGSKDCMICCEGCRRSMYNLTKPTGK